MSRIDFRTSIVKAQQGYGNPANVRRTVDQYARAGFAGIMIEDQVMPKRCGHTGVRDVVDREEAIRRVRAAVDAREGGAGTLIVARTDARSALGLDEALWRMQAFADVGADILFPEAPRDEAEMRRFCTEVPGIKMANMLEEGTSGAKVVAVCHCLREGYRSTFAAVQSALNTARLNPDTGEVK